MGSIHKTLLRLYLAVKAPTALMQWPTAISRTQLATLTTGALHTGHPSLSLNCMALTGPSSSLSHTSCRSTREHHMFRYHHTVRQFAVAYGGTG